MEFLNLGVCATLCVVACDLVMCGCVCHSGRTSGTFPAQPNAVAQEFAHVSSRNLIITIMPVMPGRSSQHLFSRIGLPSYINLSRRLVRWMKQIHLPRTNLRMRYVRLVHALNGSMCSTDKARM